MYEGGDGELVTTATGDDTAQAAEAKALVETPPIPAPPSPHDSIPSWILTSREGLPPLDLTLLDLPLEPEKSPRAGRLASVILLGVAVFALLLIIVPGAIMESDGQSMVQVTRSIVERHDFTVSTPLYGQLNGVPGVGGQEYSKYGPGQSLVAVPFYLLGRAAMPILPAYYQPEAPIMAASTLTALVTALTAMLVMLSSIALGATRRGGVVLGLIYVLCTPALVYATQWFSEPLTGCLILASFYALLRARGASLVERQWSLRAAGVALAAAVATRPDALVLAPPLLVYGVLSGERRQRVRRAVVILAPLLLTLAALAFFNQSRFGSPFETGYNRDDIYTQEDTHPIRSVKAFFVAVYGLLFSPGKGLLEYAPVVLLLPLGAFLLWKQRRNVEVTVIGLVALIALVVHADILIRWVGGWSWGPRFLMPVLPLLLLLLSPLLGRTAPGGRLLKGGLATLALLGLLLQIPAAIIHEPNVFYYDLRPAYCLHRDVNHCPTRDRLRMENDIEFNPTASPITAAIGILFYKGTWTPEHLFAPDRVARRGVITAPHTWWYLLYLQGAPIAGLAAACAIFLTLFVAGLSLSLRLSRDPPPLANPMWSATPSTVHY